MTSNFYSIIFLRDWQWYLSLLVAVNDLANLKKPLSLAVLTVRIQKIHKKLQDKNLSQQASHTNIHVSEI